MAERSSLRVLLVEDDAEDAFLTRRLLAHEGGSFVVSQVSSLEDGLREVAAAPPDVVLLDLALPGCGGTATFERMHAAAPDVPVVILSGLADEETAVRVVRQGAQDYLIKGRVDAASLSRALRYAAERMQFEKELQRYRENLEILVRERTAELQKAVTKLEANDRAKSDFVSNVSHELRTPVASMTYAVENLLAGVAGPLPDRARFYLSILREDCRRLRGTIEDILDISRIDANRMVLRRVTLPLRRLATQAAESMRLQAERKGIALTVSMGDAGFVSCDAQKVERALLNVIGNAVKYTPKGGAVQVQTVAREGDSPRVAVEVTDNGIGIGPEHLPRVAERFYRVGEQVSGTGLGLSLAKEILQLHGGGLEVVSPPPGTGEGTRVTLQLPAVRPPVVLAVDNNPEVLEVIRRQLGAEGYAVNSCRDASVALGVLQRKEADVLLCDLILPSTDGADLIAKVKGDPELRHVPIIAMTGGEVDRGKHDLLASFAIPILAKPWTREDLLGHVQEGLLGKQYL